MIPQAGDILRRFLLIFVLLAAAAGIFCEIVLPPLAQSTLANRVQTLTKADKVDVSIKTSPACFLLLGQADQVKITAENALLGQVRVQTLELTAADAGFDVTQLDNPQGPSIRRADSLQLRAVIQSESLAELIRKKVDRLENVEVEISPQSISVTAQSKIFGRMADIRIEGTVLEEDGSIYFRMSSLSIKNAVVGKAAVGNFFGDIVLTNLRTLPFEAQLDDVVQKDGEVVITASRH